MLDTASLFLPTCKSYTRLCTSTSTCTCTCSGSHRVAKLQLIPPWLLISARSSLYCQPTSAPSVSFSRSNILQIGYKIHIFLVWITSVIHVAVLFRRVCGGTLLSSTAPPTSSYQPVSSSTISSQETKTFQSNVRHTCKKYNIKGAS